MNGKTIEEILGRLNIMRTLQKHEFILMNEN